jgi:hypothetical protein
MSRLSLCFALVTLSAATLFSQDKPRVFVQGKQSEYVTHNLQKDCSGVIPALNQLNSDYTIMLGHESKKDRVLLRSNSQVEVINRLGDILGTNTTRSADNAAQIACRWIVADWQGRGSLGSPAAASPSSAPAAALVPRPAQIVTAAAPLQRNPPVSSTGPASTDPESLGETARRAKQHADCLKLAKDNPAITCN